jgi:hypothetical protein
MSHNVKLISSITPIRVCFIKQDKLSNVVH